MTIEQNKKKVLKSFLDICVLDGWVEETLQKAIKESKVKDEGIFSNISEVVDFFIDQGNEELVKKANKIDFSKLRVRDRIKELVKLRLLIDEKHKNPVKALVAISKGKEIPNLLKNSYKIADIMWELAGDTSNNFNVYTKRLILSKVFTRTFLFFINDESKNYKKSWEFLDDQIEKVMIIGKVKMQIKKYMGKIKDCGNLKSKVKDLPFLRLVK